MSSSSPEPSPLKTTLKTKNRINSGARVLVDAKDIIKTYSKEEQFSCQKYAEYQKLIKENPSFGYKRCAKILGVPAGRTRWWHTKGEKKAIPLPLKAVEKLRNAGLLPLTSKHKDIEEIFRILGTLFGDGGIDIRLNTMAFISSKIEGIGAWKGNLIKIAPFVKEKIDLREGGEYGHSYNIRTFDRSIIRFFIALGAPVGDKVSTVYSLPPKIFTLSRAIRIAFLDGILSSEVSVPSWREDGHGSYRFTDLTLGLSKIEKLEKEHIVFLESLKRLSESVGVDTTPNIRRDFKTSHRKDDNQSHCFRIFFRTHFHRVLYFDSLFPLIYAKDKKKRLQEQIQTAIQHRKRQALNSKEAKTNKFN